MGLNKGLKYKIFVIIFTKNWEYPVLSDKLFLVLYLIDKGSMLTNALISFSEAD